MNLSAPTSTPANLDPATPPPEVAPAPASRPARTRRPPLKAFVHLLRRCHLYTGLFLLPWVFLYAITGFLFNHPGAFSDRTDLLFGPTEMRDTPLEQLPSAADVAGQVVTALNARGQGSYRLVQPEKAQFERGLTANVRADDGKQYVVVLQPNGAGRVIPLRQERGGGEAPAPFAARKVQLEQPATDRVEAGLPLVLARVGLADASVTETRLAPVSFLMEGDGQLWQVSYNLQSGSVSGKVANRPPPAVEMSTRQFLLRLHLAHGYPSEVNARWIWAIVVDVMAGVMVFWGLTGLVMWWQIKATRWFGAIVLIGSVVAAVWVGVGMHSLLTAR